MSRKIFLTLTVAVALAVSSLSSCFFPIPDVSVSTEDASSESESGEYSEFFESSEESSEESSSSSGEVETVGNGDIEFHFLEVGNTYTGDCTYIRVGDVDILIDAGSREKSAATIATYLNNYVTDGVLEYVIVTHAHRDHIAGFVSTSSCDSIFRRYECETIIEFSRTDVDTAIYTKYLAERNAEVSAGATLHKAGDLVLNNMAEFILPNGVTMTILDSYFYYHESSDENNYSVCTLFSAGESHYLFTGDLEEKGEEWLVEMNDLPEVELFKAGHHGSYTATSDTLLSVIRPKRIVVCCCAGHTEYTTNAARTFPSQDFCDRVAPYTKEVYVTTMVTSGGFASMNGNVVVASVNGVITVTGSNNSTPLYLTAWFAENRTRPSAWALPK